MKKYEEVIDEILATLDKATTRGVKIIEEYLREHGGTIEIDGSGDRMYAIAFDYDMKANVETEILGLRLAVTETAPKGELELLLDYPYNDWVSIYDEIWILPTVQSILEAIDQYE